MERFVANRGQFGQFETVTLKDADTGAQAVFARHGATLLSYHVPFRGELVDVADGFATPKELADQVGGRSWIMAPFSNRIDNGQYEWGGKKHDLGVEDPVNRVILHGFLKAIDCDVQVELSGPDSASVTFATSKIRPGAYKGYPFAVDIAVTYTLSAKGLEVVVVGTNVGDEDAPYCCGWHPYFKTSAEGIDTLKLEIPCKTAIIPDKRLLPLAGDAAYKPIEQVSEKDFRPGRPGDGNILGDLFIDASFADLAYGADGLARTVLTDPATGMIVTVYQERGLMHVFTGDTLPMRQRHSIALEPVEVMTNAFNRPECREAVTLPSGKSRSYRFGIAVSG